MLYAARLGRVARVVDRHGAELPRDVAAAFASPISEEDVLHGPRGSPKRKDVLLFLSLRSHLAPEHGLDEYP